MKRLLLLLILGLVTLSVSAQQTHTLASIEIGASGIKGLAFQATDIEDGYTVKQLYDRQINVQLIGGMKDGNLQEDRIKNAAAAAAELAGELKKLDPEYIFIAASTAYSDVKNRDALATAIKDATFQNMDFIHTEDEVYYGMLGNIPLARLKYSVFIDVGGSNTKAGYETRLARNGFESIAFPYGARTLEDAVSAATKRGESGALKRFLTKDVAQAVKDAASDKPGLSNISRPIYIIGGSSWAAATLARPNDVDKPFVKLKLAELSALNSKLQEKDVQDILPAKLSDASAAEIRDVQDAFSPDRLRVGIGLLVTVLENLGSGKNNASERQIIFPRQTAKSGWMYGYMFSKYNEAVGIDKKKR